MNLNSPRALQTLTPCNPLREIAHQPLSSDEIEINAKMISNFYFQTLQGSTTFLSPLIKTPKEEIRFYLALILQKSSTRLSERETLISKTASRALTKSAPEFEKIFFNFIQGLSFKSGKTAETHSPIEIDDTCLMPPPLPLSLSSSIRSIPDSLKNRLSSQKIAFSKNSDQENPLSTTIPVYFTALRSAYDPKHTQTLRHLEAFALATDNHPRFDFILTQTLKAITPLPQNNPRTPPSTNDTKVKELKRLYHALSSTTEEAPSFSNRANPPEPLSFYLNKISKLIPSVESKMKESQLKNPEEQEKATEWLIDEQRPLLTCIQDLQKTVHTLSEDLFFQETKKLANLFLEWVDLPLSSGFETTPTAKSKKRKKPTPSETTNSEKIS